MALTLGYNFQLDDSDDEFERTTEDRFTGKTALLVVIDCSPSMFKGWEDNEETPFLAAIKCCESIWRSKIVSNPGDLVSIVFIGTENTNSSNFPNIYELQGLSTVKVDMIKELIEMKNSDDFNGFPDKVGSSTTYNLKDLFWLAKMNFDIAKTQTFFKKIMFFTCEDNPHRTNPNLQTDAISKFKDLGTVDLNIVSFKEDFQFNKFYSKLMEDDSAVIYSKNLDSLMQIVRMKQRLKRPLSRSTLEVTPGVKIGVGFYSFVRQAKPPKCVSINRRNNEVIERTVNVFRSDSGMPVLKSEERKVVQVQGEMAVFTPQEVKEIKYFQETGLKILGFLRSELFDNFNWYRSPCYFLYPDEEKISGSKDFFSTLLRRCQVLEKVPIVRYVLSRGRTPKLGVLIPSIPEGNSKSLLPQGFQLFPVPFSDEMRKHDLGSTVVANSELVEVMEKVVRKLTNTSFNILDVKNPSLQLFWRKLEEEALEERVDDSQELNLTEPSEDLMKKRLKGLPLEIEQQVKGGAFTSTQSTAPVKKNVIIDMAMEAKHGRLERCTCQQLREYLESKGVEVPLISGKKDLIRLVVNSFVDTQLGLD